MKGEKIRALIGDNAQTDGRPGTFRLSLVGALLEVTLGL
jgi:hypothetical protein